MDTILFCNAVLDGCGVLLLLLSIVPYMRGGVGRQLNRRRRDLLFYAALAHLFVLLLKLTGTRIALSLHNQGVRGIFTAAAVLPAVLSAALLGLFLLCDENGGLRLPRGRDIPLEQIACTLLPPVLGRCLQLAFPGLSLTGLMWSVALQLNQSLLQIDSEKRLEAAERRLSREQALLMSVQMQPHFLFNTLSAIGALCHTDAAAAEESIANLSGYLRRNIDALRSESMIPFDEELRHIRQYVALELADPARQFHFDYELDVRDFTLPALTAEPIVENAVKHGALTHRDGTGRVLLSTEELGDYIRITVTDNGVCAGSLTDKQRTRQGVGIENTAKRLEELCGGSLSYTSGESGARAVLLIPRLGGKRNAHTDR